MDGPPRQRHLELSPEDRRKWKPKTYKGRFQLKRSENGLQEAVVALLRRSGLSFPDECVWYHPFNSIPLEDGNETIALAKGLNPGLFDLCLERLGDPTGAWHVTPRGICYTSAAPVRLWIEFKRDPKYVLSEAQERMKAFYVKAGVPVYLVATYRRALELLREYGFLRPGCS